MENSVSNASQFYLDSEEIRKQSTWSDNVEVLMGNETDDIITELFDSFSQGYQKRLEKLQRNGSNFIFDGVDLLSYRLHETSMKRGKLYIESSEWLKTKRATINPKMTMIIAFSML